MQRIDKIGVLMLQMLVFGRCFAYEIPEVMIQALDPSGLRVSLPDAPGITAVEFIGMARGGIHEAVQSHPEGERWTLLVPDLQLKDGDVLQYMVFVTVNNDDSYLKDGLLYTVNGREKVTVPAPPPPTTTTTTTTPKPTTQAYYVPPSTRLPPTTKPPPTTTPCPRSVTSVRGRADFCVGEVIFEDKFDEINESVWRIEHKIPSDHPEYPFVTYLRSQVEFHRSAGGKGLLVIEPKLLSLTQITDGIDLGDNCTGRASECRYRADGADIVRPVASGRVTSKDFAFKYGRVDVRAKLPQGDWLYPELLLEEYSPWSQFNGIMKIASARGNRNVQDRNGIEFGSEVLYGGLSYSRQCKERIFKQVSKRHIQRTRGFWDSGLSLSQQSTWPDAFHEYSLVWAPTGVTFSVDGRPMGRELQPPYQGTDCDPRKRSTEMSPFDRDYKLSFGVAAGGVWVFQDELKTLSGIRLRNKPWRNNERKAMLNFFNAQKHWLRTWEDNSNLQISHVRVTAL